MLMMFLAGVPRYVKHPFVLSGERSLNPYYTVPPAELESVLLEHPDIVDAAVIGVELDTDREVTEVPRYVLPRYPSSYPSFRLPHQRRAFVVHTKGKDAAPKSFPADVQKWIESRVARHKYLRGGASYRP